MEKIKKHLTLDKIQQLENSIGFLSNYKTPDNEEHHIGFNINCVDVKETNLLIELGRINKRREQIISELMKPFK